MNELLLVVAVLLLLVIPQFFLKKLHQPLLTYVKLAMALVMMVLAWGFSEPDKWPIKLILTTVVLTSAIMTIAEYRKMNDSQPKRNKVR